MVINQDTTFCCFDHFTGNMDRSYIASSCTMYFILGTYARVQMLHGLSVHKARKSSPQEGSCEPCFNESFGFTIPCRQLEACSIRVTLMMSQHGLLTSQDREYGRVTVGSYLYARGEQSQHWQEMIANSRTPITKSHTMELPPSAANKASK